MKTESRRQKQLASEIKNQLAEIMIKNSFSVIEGCLVTISDVKVTPDLLIAKIYFSFYNSQTPEKMLEYIANRKSEIRHYLGIKMKNLRRIPELEFFHDQSTSIAFKIDQLLQDHTSNDQ